MSGKEAKKSLKHLPTECSGPKTLQGLPGYNKSIDLSLHGSHLDTRSAYNDTGSPEIYGCIDTNLVGHEPSLFSIYFFHNSHRKRII